MENIPNGRRYHRHGWVGHFNVISRSIQVHLVKYPICPTRTQKNRNFGKFCNFLWQSRWYPEQLSELKISRFWPKIRDFDRKSEFWQSLSKKLGIFKTPLTGPFLEIRNFIIFRTSSILNFRTDRVYHIYRIWLGWISKNLQSSVFRPKYPFF